MLDLTYLNAFYDCFVGEALLKQCCFFMKIYVRETSQKLQNQFILLICWFVDAFRSKLIMSSYFLLGFVFLVKFLGILIFKLPHGYDVRPGVHHATDFCCNHLMLAFSYDTRRIFWNIAFDLVIIVMHDMRGFSSWRKRCFFMVFSIKFLT